MKTEPPSRCLAGLYAITPDWNDMRRLLISRPKRSCAPAAVSCSTATRQTTPCHRQEQAAPAQLTRAYDALLIVNDDVELALAAAPMACIWAMMTASLPPPAPARRRSACSACPATRACRGLWRRQQAGADYLAFGSFFAVADQTAGQTRRPGTARQEAQRTGLPVVRHRRHHPGQLRAADRRRRRPAGGNQRAVRYGLDPDQAATPISKSLPIRNRGSP
jgi:hypothetical protein